MFVWIGFGRSRCVCVTNVHNYHARFFFWADFLCHIVIENRAIVDYRSMEDEMRELIIDKIHIGVHRRPLRSFSALSNAHSYFLSKIKII